jgi:DNA-binding response OmpR family regulator
VVADGAAERQVLCEFLREQGYAVLEASDAPSARRVATSTDVDLILVDLDLSLSPNLEILPALRGNRDVRLIVCVEQEQLVLSDLEVAPEIDDFLVKPVFLPEARVRIHSVLQRDRAPSYRRLEFPDLIIDPTTRQVQVRGELVELTQREFDLLIHLATSPGVVHSREDLLTQVWPFAEDGHDVATVTEHIRRIRIKIEIDPRQPRWIRTVRGVGYRFERRFRD